MNHNPWLRPSQPRLVLEPAYRAYLAERERLNIHRTPTPTKETTT